MKMLSENWRVEHVNIYVYMYLYKYIYIGGLMGYISKKVAAYGQFVLVLYYIAPISFAVDLMAV